MTSNIGSEFLLEGIDDDGNIKDEAEKQVSDMLKMHFRPEFLNRLDEIIMFKPLTKDNISGIVDLLMVELNKRVADKELTIELSSAARDFVIDRGYDPVYGARPLKRFLQKNVETLVARAILSNTLAMGDTIVLDVEGDKLVCRNK
jgi:ATP-dependent Clp protease ATP-binding subunit ClpB